MFNSTTDARVFIDNLTAPGPSTNYTAASTATQTQFQTMNTSIPNANNTVFFISDGSVTSGGEGYYSYVTDMEAINSNVNLHAVGFSGANTTQLDFMDNTNGSKVLSNASELQSAFLITLSGYIGIQFFTDETLLVNDTDSSNSPASNSGLSVIAGSVLVDGAQGNLVSLGNGIYSYTPSVDEMDGSADAPTIKYSITDADNNTDSSVLTISINLQQGTSGNDSLTGTDYTDTIYGLDGDDILIGLDGSDVLDGGAGQDTMTGGEGNDIFVIRTGDGNTNINLADHITDFTDGDRLGGVGNIDLFSQLTVAQDTADTVITLTSTGEVLAILDSFTATNFDANDFVQLDIV